MTTERLTKVHAPEFSAGLVFEDGVCIEASETMAWAIGRSEADVRAWCLSKGWWMVTLRERGLP